MLFTQTLNKPIYANTHKNQIGTSNTEIIKKIKKIMFPVFKTRKIQQYTFISLSYFTYSKINILNLKLVKRRCCTHD